MPNIAFNVAQPLGSNACGAYCVAACLDAFGRQPVAAFDLDYNVPGTAVRRHSIIPSHATRDVFGRQIYVITGLLDLNPALAGAAAAAQYRREPDFYNAPSAMTWVARQLGSNVTVNVLPGVFAAVTAAFPSEQNMITAAGGVVNGAAAYAPPGANEVQLLLVNNSTHWVARGSNGLYYDPADGVNTHTWVNPGGAGTALGPHTFSGLWMSVT